MYLTNNIHNTIAGIVCFVFLRHSAPIRAGATGHVPEPDMRHSVPERETPEKRDKPNPSWESPSNPILARSAHRRPPRF